METNDIKAAPQVADTQAIYTAWQRTRSGSLDSFYGFMTTPGAERDEFISSLGGQVVRTISRGTAQTILIADR